MSRTRISAAIGAAAASIAAAGPALATQGLATMTPLHVSLGGVALAGLLAAGALAVLLARKPHRRPRRARVDRQEPAPDRGLLADLIVTQSGPMVRPRTPDDPPHTDGASNGAARQPVEMRPEDTRSLFESLIDGVDGVLFRVSLDDDPRFIFVSANLERLSGIKPEDLIGQPIGLSQAIIHPEDWTRYWDDTLRSIAGREPRQIDYRIVLPDGRIRNVFERTSPVWDDAGVARFADGFIVDVTALREIEARLERSEWEARRVAERFEAFSAIAADWVWETGPDLRVTFTSAGVAAVGLTPETAIGFDIVGAADAGAMAGDEVAAHVAALAAHEPFRGALVPYRRPDGGRVWLESSAEPMIGKDGTFLGYRGASRDVTQLVEAREGRDAAAREIAVRDQMLEDITAHMDGVLYRIALEPELPYRFVSKGIERFVGKPVSELIGRPVACNPMRIHPDDEERYFTTCADAIANNQGFSVEYRAYDAQGRLRWLHETGRPSAIDDDGTPRAVDGFFVDVTHIKQLAVQNELFARAIAQLDTGVAMADVSQPGAPLIYVNEAFTRITGYSYEEVVGSNCRFLQGEGTDPAAVDALREAIAARRAVAVEILNYRKDGMPFWNELTLAPMRNPETGQDYFVAIQKDVTARREAASVLARARDAAEAGSAAKSQFLAMMSHEIRTPMNGVVGMAQVLLESDLSDPQKRAALSIRDSAESLLEILDDVLDLSKLEAGRLEVEQVDFDLAAVVDSVLSIMGGRARAKGVELRATLDPGCPRHVSGDPLRIRQVLLNLVGNAIKFTDRGHVGIEVRPDGASVRFRVIDTGIGIPAHRLPHLFEEYMQIDASISRRYGGTGLGLAICRRLVERMDGEIGVDSTEGAGSVFWFRLRLPEAAARDRAASEPAPAEAGLHETRARLARLGRPPQVLIVEDNATNIEVARALLSKEGWGLTLAVTAAEGVAAATRGGFDVVLMDLHLPDGDGRDATRAIRALPGPEGRVPIIGLTANAFASDAADCLAAGMQAHVAKPYRKDHLMRVIADHIAPAGAEPQPDETRAAPVRKVAARSRKAPPAARKAVPRPAKAKARPARGRSAPALDWHMIEAYRADAGEEGLLAMLEIFVADSAAKLAELAQLPATAEGARTALRLVHSLKSAGAMAGAAAFSARAAELEQALVEASVPPPRGEVASLKSSFSAWRRSLRTRGVDLDA